jgi:DNA polymerase kappa
MDMDAFYAAVEERDDHTLRGVPFAVGGIGMISTANYVARKFGVRSAMPGFIALKLCPHLRCHSPPQRNPSLIIHHLQVCFS